MRRTVKLKSDLHKLIDAIDNEALLEVVYQLLNTKKEDNQGELLSKLSVEEKRELYEAYEDSQNETNLIDFDKIKDKHSGWQKNSLD